MIEVYSTKNEKLPIKTIPYTFPSESDTFSCESIFQEIEQYEEIFDMLDEEDSDLKFFVYLQEGDIWMDCGLIPPNPEILLWTKDFKEKKVSIKYI